MKDKVSCTAIENMYFKSLVASLT